MPRRGTAESGTNLAKRLTAEFAQKRSEQKAPGTPAAHRPQRKANYTTRTLPVNPASARVAAPVPAALAPDKAAAPATPQDDTKYLLVPVKTMAKGPGAKPHYDTLKVPQTSVVDVPRDKYEIKSKGKTGPKGQIPTAYIFYGEDRFHALGDADGNFYGGRMVDGKFVPKRRFLADPDEQAAIKAAKLAAEAEALKAKQEAAAKARQDAANARQKRADDRLKQQLAKAKAAAKSAAKPANGSAKKSTKKK